MFFSESLAGKGLTNARSTVKRKLVFKQLQFNISVATDTWLQQLATRRSPRSSRLSTGRHHLTIVNLQCLSE